MPTPDADATAGRRLDAVQKRTLRVLFAAQVFSGAGLAAGITVGALLAQDMLGSTGLAGLPTALFTIGSAAAAAGVGGLSQRLGRRTGLAAGYATGALGSIGIIAAAVAGNVALLFVALFVYGAGTATNLQARYAGADLAHRDHSARAISTVLVATTLGAVVGPNLVDVLGDIAVTIGVPRLAGPFLLAAFAYGTAAIIIWILLRPDPLLLAAALPDRDGDVDLTGAPPEATSAASSIGNRFVLAGAAVMMITQLVMVAIMTMTPVYMQHHHHELADAGLVISIHVAAMYLPSPLSGYLVDRIGAPKTAGLAALALVAAGVLASLAPADSVVALAAALALLGFGWSLGLISGTTTVANATALETRAKTQGTVDLFVALAGAAGGLLSGVIVAATSYPTLAVIGAGAGAALVPILLLGRRRHPADTG
ncbi:MFS transporter [Mycobacterium sp. CVI_P3]|uniref:MFS transporter n=1 Tax=Mycobacterium pinniadriaticum TaxID=2994102 RepID=A0ABT3SCJ7_9MYCO|nr:MFS transporter [Mycobacterium pinniadriaticum]MCX2930806.1 MFS transporter [Mycobacterium pinniadriaticum]MCX2937230.1 MFS transporter [Mycobacterium pinniadriaticum]